jgi:SAM-dependent methyltransferase
LYLLTVDSSFVSKYTEKEWQRDFMNKMTAFLLLNINWIGVPFNEISSTFESSSAPTSLRVLDYACGPGTMTAALENRATEYCGIDLSDGMVNAYNERFNSETSESQKFQAHAIVGNLLEETVPEHLSDPRFFRFDLAVVGVGFHHFSDVQLATKRLAERLKPDGVLLIVDFLSHAPEDKYKNIISHHGFSEETVKGLFEGAGLQDFELLVDKEPWPVHEKTRTGFMARGRKPSAPNL